jgi:hypothetical protein
MNYDDIQYWKLSENKYLFFDIFHKDNEIILICPVYYRDYDYTEIKIKNGNNFLELKKKILKIQYEPIVVLIFKYKSDKENTNIIIEYLNESKSFSLKKYNLNDKKKLCQTTLFKNDYNLIDLFYDYYTNQGVEQFFLYYNGKITNIIKEKCNKPNIKLIEWNYSYWNENCDFKHHAQMGQIYHAMYKYGKNEYQYMIFNDLDEYMHIKNKKIINLINKNEYISIYFYNYWSKTLDNILPISFPKKIKTTKNPTDEYPKRTKAIHNLDYINITGIHYSKEYPITNKKIYINKNNMLLHFYNWTKTNRKEKTDTLYEL